MNAKRIEIKGEVWDVGYRLFLLSEAERLLIEKFDARNIPVNGEQHLIVLVEGAEEKINKFVEFAKSNYPSEASVESVEVKDYEGVVRGIDSFRQSFMVAQLAKIAQAGVGMLKKQDKTLEKQDLMIENQYSMIGKQEDTIEVIKEESKKTREVLKDKIEEDVEWLKGEIIDVTGTLEKVKEKVNMI